MRTRTSFAAAFTLPFYLAIGASAFAQASVAEAPASDSARPAANANAKAKRKSGKGPDMAAMAAAWEKAGAVGEAHKHLQKRVGTWTVVTKFWMAPDQPPMESTGTTDVKSLLDDRFIQSTFKGSMMGKPFSGVATNGYDNTKKKYVGTWIDSMSTGIMRMEGTADPSGKKLVYTSVSTDPMTGKDSGMRIVETWESDTKIVEEFFEKRGGKEMKAMELTYTKK